ncbi:hypothetical protein DLAC_04400 [Tieghemostelium lacteum]|uniref:Voltage-gated hydrogen channel 1 n=1 Tax=Tieghemostelium lacteum TaxID=361077 RepID=A0A151ZJN7_TIELA|nr:hypothetical protein DLAC_04400 [Tieghemostelium lacteum]|eukprot:KYQ94119.1 hypothetical protein DLAC_04400 [Tieghemostelium lacteum]
MVQVTQIEYKFPFHFVIHKDTHQKRKPWRKQLGLFLESTKFQYFIVGLIMLDLIIVITELFLDEHYKCKEHHEIPEDVEKAENVFTISTLVILGLFELEAILLLVAFGRDFFKHPLYVFDAVIVTISIIVETVFKDKVGALLVVFRLWRIVRIGHGILVTVDTEATKKQKDMKKKIKKQAIEIRGLNHEIHLLKLKYGETVSTITSPNTTSQTTLTSFNSSPVLSSDPIIPKNNENNNNEYDDDDLTSDEDINSDGKFDQIA